VVAVVLEGPTAVVLVPVAEPGVAREPCVSARAELDILARSLLRHELGPDRTPTFTRWPPTRLAHDAIAAVRRRDHVSAAPAAEFERRVFHLRHPKGNYLICYEFSLRGVRRQIFMRKCAIRYIHRHEKNPTSLLNDSRSLKSSSAARSGPRARSTTRPPGPRAHVSHPAVPVPLVSDAFFRLVTHLATSKSSQIA